MPTLSHDTTSTISRRVNGLALARADAALIRPLVDRIEVAMVVGAGRGEAVYPLGRYMVADAADVTSTGGNTAMLTLFDEMFIVDQQLDTAFDAGGQLVNLAVERLLDGLPIAEVDIDATEQTSTNSWSPGSGRGGALTDLATQGGYFKPWFDNNGRLRVMRAFEPAAQAPGIDLDDTRRVVRDSISRVSDLLTAPNRFVVVSNDPGGDGDSQPIVGTYDVPASAPHSISQRGFVISKQVDAQLPTPRQVQVYARTLGIQQTIYEVVELSTPADPRHDGYDVVRWDDQLWLEVGWEMPLAPGAQMRHTLRRAYPDTTGAEL